MADLSNVSHFAALVVGGILVLAGVSIIVFTLKYGPEFTLGLYIEAKALLARLVSMLPGA